MGFGRETIATRAMEVLVWLGYPQAEPGMEFVFWTKSERPIHVNVFPVMYRERVIVVAGRRSVQRASRLTLAFVSGACVWSGWVSAFRHSEAASSRLVHSLLVHNSSPHSSQSFPNFTWFLPLVFLTVIMSFRISSTLWDKIHHFASFPQTGGTNYS